MIRKCASIIAFLLLCYNSGLSQKVSLLQSYPNTLTSEHFIFAKDNFYLNKDSHFDSYNLTLRNKFKIYKFGNKNLAPGASMGAVGNAIIYTTIIGLRFADMTGTDLRLIPDQNSTLTTDQLISSYRITPGDGVTLIACKYIENTVIKSNVLAFNAETKLIKPLLDSNYSVYDIAYFEPNKTMYFVADTYEYIELFATEGTKESTKVISRIKKDLSLNFMETRFISNGEELYLVNSFNKGPFSYNYNRDINQVIRINTAHNNTTDLGTYDNRFLQPPYAKNNIIYGYAVASNSVVKIANNSSTTLLPNSGSSMVWGEFNNKIIFTRSPDAYGSLRDLFETDGTLEGTRQITDQISNIGEMVNYNGKLYFFKKHDEFGLELWCYDGTKVYLVTDVVKGLVGLTHTKFYIYNDDLYLTGRRSDDINNLNLYKIEEASSTITLSTYADYNANSIRDTNEPLLLNTKYDLNPGQLTLFTSKEYTLPLSNGSYSLTATPMEGWVPTSVKPEVAVDLPQQDKSHFAFGFKPLSLITKFEATLTSEGTRCNSESSYTLHYSNSGFTNVSGSIKLISDSNLAFQSALPAPTSIKGDTLEWELINLVTQQKGNIKLSFLLPGVDHIGDTLKSTLLTNFVSEYDGAISAETTTIKRVLTCSYDPNDIEAIPFGEGEKHLTLKSKPIKYLIRFQNMGTDKAMDIVVRNKIQTDMDLNTLKILDHSHNMYAKLKGDEISFYFDNIQLPDHHVDEPGSHGYILYSILPKAGVQDSTVINNQALIYFDFNPAIETNITFNTLVTSLHSKKLLSVEPEVEDTSVIIYPNPAYTFINVHYPAYNNSHVFYQVTNSLGQKILSGKLTSGNSESINITSLNPGIYLLRLTNQQKSIVKKIIKK